MKYEAGQQCLNGTNISKVIGNCGKTIDVLVSRSRSCENSLQLMLCCVLIDD